MSRTYNHRPLWVKLNDPKFPTKERHQHYTIKREKSGKMETRTRHRWVGGPEWTVAEEYEVPHYYTWVEAVPCTIDVPEVRWTEERERQRKATNDKLCDKRELYSRGCPCCTRKSIKSLTNGARRSKVRQAMSSAVRDYGKWYIIPGDETSYDDGWEDVDIFPVSKYDSPYWWD